VAEADQAAEAADSADVDLAEADQAAEAADSAETEEVSTAQEKCTKLFAVTVNKTAKCHSSRQKENQSIVKTATPNTRNTNFSSNTTQ
jgi:hypothetical protein